MTVLRQARGPEGQCGDIPGRASAARGRRRSRAVPSGGHGCGRAPLSAAISAAFPSAAAAAREPLFPVTNMPCGQAQPPRRFPSVATFTQALGPLVPRITAKCLYRQINLPCKVSHYRLGRLRRGRISRVGSEVGDARTGRTPTLLSRTTRGWEAASPRGGFGRFKATAASDPEATVTLQPPD